MPSFFEINYQGNPCVPVIGYLSLVDFFFFFQVQSQQTLSYFICIYSFFFLFFFSSAQVCLQFTSITQSCIFCVGNYVFLVIIALQISQTYKFTVFISTQLGRDQQHQTQLKFSIKSSYKSKKKRYRKRRPIETKH